MSLRPRSSLNLAHDVICLFPRQINCRVAGAARRQLA
jgi:hypothetical protein